ncbi:polyprenyl synthetase family protein [Oceanobacillus senegalensis]|uniref:polyprenyl synthetase family protein n=1 Tax=Oceanobacillus senegalensis TaxID=1936063 RepID=UPI000A31147A|nr:polyprenyl synthetase family protein [Oceanobacillus senegalensis]
MNMEKVLQNSELTYQQAERRAADYFHSLSLQFHKKKYIDQLISDFHSWKRNHIQRSKLFSFFTKEKNQAKSLEYLTYIEWLDYKGKLDRYLDRSITYIFMRDLGKTIDAKDTQELIHQSVNRLKKQVLEVSSKDRKQETFSMASLYRLAEKNGVEATMIWLVDKLKTAISSIPQGMDAEEAHRKLIKIIAGVVMNAMEEMEDNLPLSERSRKLDEAIRLGYCYGLTYPFVDDLLDSNILSSTEEKRYSDLIRTTLTTGSVPELGEWAGPNQSFIQFVHAELREAFIYIKSCQQQERWKSFLDQSFVFFKSQEMDRDKSLNNSTYSEEELYIPVIIKSASSRLIVRSLIHAPEDEGFDNRTFYFGIYNQLADDFTDMYEDLEGGRVTPYTYYLKYHDSRTDLINPYELYWVVVYNLIHHVYHSDKKASEVILSRAINGQKRLKERMGKEAYKRVMAIFASENPRFHQLIQQLVHKAVDVDFFDKLLRDHIIHTLRKDGAERDKFVDTVRAVRKQINDDLPIPFSEKTTLNKDTLNNAANFSLKNEGKRLRPVMAWFMAKNKYGLETSAIMPLLKSLEYMHTASLIYDDLPSQDDASLRRGRPTVHQFYNIATAELTALFLTQKAVEEQASLNAFESEKVLQLVHYSARATADMCKGQVIDLESKGKILTLEELNTMCYYKTAIGFEASLMMPAILAGADEKERNALKKFAKHAGITFQIKDDILDVEGKLHVLGKVPNKDRENNNTTFVTVLGLEGAKKAMWEHYCKGMEVLDDIPGVTTFLQQFLNYMMNRDY